MNRGKIYWCFNIFKIFVDIFVNYCYVGIYGIFVVVKCVGLDNVNVVCCGVGFLNV